MGQTAILREGWTRDHLSAICAMSPEGRLSVHGQNRAIDAADVVVFLEHLRREVIGRMVVIWDGAPMHRRHSIQEFLTNGASLCLHLEHLPAYAPELNPDEGISAYVKGVEGRNLCGFDVPPISVMHDGMRSSACDASRVFSKTVSKGPVFSF